MKASEAKRLKDLEQENTRLKKLAADQCPDNAMLKGVVSGDFWARQAVVRRVVVFERGSLPPRDGRVGF